MFWKIINKGNLWTTRKHNRNISNTLHIYEPWLGKATSLQWCNGYHIWFTSKKLVVWFQPEIFGCGFACGRISGVKIWAAERSLLTNKAVSSAPQVWVSSPLLMIKGGKHRGTYNTITKYKKDTGVMVLTPVSIIIHSILAWIRKPNNGIIKLSFDLYWSLERLHASFSQFVCFLQQSE